MKDRSLSRWGLALQGLYVICLGTAVIPLGAVHDPVIAVAGLLFAAISTSCIFRSLRPELQAPMIAVTAVFGVIVIWAFLQTLPLGLAHPSWGSALEALGPLGPPRGAITVSPYATFSGLSSVLVPGMALLTGIVLFQDDASARRLVWFAALLALAGAIMGIYEFVATPGQLLFQPRRHPMDGVTAFFVNRNTAATFLGMGSVIWLAILTRRIASLGVSGVKSLLIETDGEGRGSAIGLLSLSLGLLAMIVALFLTKSRAGISSSLAGMFVTLIATLPRQTGDAVRGSRITALIASAAFVVGIVALYGSQFITRVTHSDATEDGRWCFFEGMISSIKDWPFTGTGFATIRNVYPAYQDPVCFGTEDILDRGHNGYLEIAMGMGLGSWLVLAVGIVLLVKLLVGGIKARRQMTYVPAAALGVLVIGVLHSTVDFSLQIPGVATFAAAVLAAGIVVALPPVRRRRMRRRKQLAIA